MVSTALRKLLPAKSLEMLDAQADRAEAEYRRLVCRLVEGADVNPDELAAAMGAAHRTQADLEAHLAILTERFDGHKLWQQHAEAEAELREWLKTQPDPERVAGEGRRLIAEGEAKLEEARRLRNEQQERRMSVRELYLEGNKLLYWKRPPSIERRLQQITSPMMELQSFVSEQGWRVESEAFRRRREELQQSVKQARFLVEQPAGYLPDPTREKAQADLDAAEKELADMQTVVDQVAKARDDIKRIESRRDAAMREQESWNCIDWDDPPKPLYGSDQFTPPPAPATAAQPFEIDFTPLAAAK